VSGPIPGICASLHRIVLPMPELDLQLQLTHWPMKLPEVVTESLQQQPTEYTR
jgi:hypothetical protein